MSTLDEIQLADYVAARAERDPRIRAIVHDAQMLEDLRESIGWRRLLEQVKERKEHFMLALAKRLMAGGEDIPTEAEIAFHRGWYAGAVFVLTKPEQAMENLERAARIAWMLGKEELMAEEGESPYI